MTEIIKILENSNVYALEYCGYVSIKLSVSNSSKYYAHINDIRVDFITGCLLLSKEGEKIDFQQGFFDLFGATTVSALISKEEQIGIEFDNGYKIYSVLNEDDSELVDRVWSIQSTTNELYFIINDGVKIHTSDMMLKLFSAHQQAI